LDSTGAIKLRYKNDLYTSTDSSHNVPYTLREYDQAVSEMGPMIIMESVKAHGSKAKPINGSEPPRATRARDEATQRVATSWDIRSPIEGSRCSQASYLSLDWEISVTPSVGWHLAVWVFCVDYLGKKHESSRIEFDRALGGGGLAPV
jgi:hypothetical protein